jgi:hypothetical protein
MEVTLLTLGVLLILVGLVGQVEAQQIQVGTRNPVVRIILGLMGAVFVFIALSKIIPFPLPNPHINTPTPTPTSSPTSAPAPTARPTNTPIAPTVVPPIPAPELTLSGTELYEASGKKWVRYRLAIANWAAFPSELFVAAPDLPPCGSNTNASRTWVDIHNAKDDSYIYGFCALSSPESLNSIWFAVEQGVNPPEAVYVSLMDRRKNTTYRSNTIAIK